MLIVSIKQKNRVNTNCIVTILDGDNEKAQLEISMDLVVKYKLGKDVDIQGDTLQHLLDEQRIIDVKQTAFNYASYSPRSRKQIIDKLTNKGFYEDEIEIALDFLIEFKLIDDALFAKKYIANTLLTKKVGKLRIINDLRNKGVAQEIAKIAADAYFNDDLSIEMALVVAEKKLKTLQNKPIQKQKNSVYNHLISKGFSFDDAKKVLAQVFNTDG
ncbi:MAG: recombination regulator RecX [Ignavibacteria bacterium]|jgi:regulatory protein|nr:recombination regulator RecX [Ignavibacteria bacterium]